MWFEIAVIIILLFIMLFNFMTGIFISEIGSALQLIASMNHEENASPPLITKNNPATIGACSRCFDNGTTECEECK
jgi:hypothetical protein